MPTLTELKKEADQLSPEEELNRRDEEMDTGKVEPISYQQFLKEVGRE